MIHKITLNERQLCDVELILNGGFSPLKGFLSQVDYHSVLQEMRLQSGCAWPIPIVLDATKTRAMQIQNATTVHLCNQEGLAIAILHVSDIWKPNKITEAKLIYGTTDETHPGVSHLLKSTHDYYIGGELNPINPIAHSDFNDLRQTPTQLREKFKSLGWDKIVGFQTRNPMHKAHVALTNQAITKHGAKLLIQPVVGLTKPGDVDYYTRVKCYQTILNYYPQNTAILHLLPLAMRMAGPREALWHVLIRKNYGCTHFIIGRDHAGPGNDRHGNPFYGPYEAQELVSKFENEINITIVKSEELRYVKELNQFQEASKIKKEHTELSVSGTKLRQMLANNEPIPDWYSYPDIIKQLRRATINKRGLTIFFTGLSGSGKSTIAKALATYLSNLHNRQVTLLDGDVVRNNLSSELNFSRKHRNINISRIAFVASEISKHGGTTICAAIAPHEHARSKAKELIIRHGEFILVHLNTPLSVCEQRDTKNLYEQARRGIIKNFTGINDPYEMPDDADITLDTSHQSPTQCLHTIIEKLVARGLLKANLIKQYNEKIAHD